MDRYKFFDIDITSLEGQKFRSNLLSPFKSRFYAVVSITTPTSRASKETLVGNSSMRFEAEQSNFQYDYSVLVIQLRRRRAFSDDKDVGEPLVIPLIELFENTQIDKAICFNSAVVRVGSKDKTELGLLYFSYGFSNKSSAKREVKNNGGSGRGGKEDVSTDQRTPVLLRTPAPAWQSNSNPVRRFRGINQKYYRLQDINNAVYQILFFT